MIASSELRLLAVVAVCLWPASSSAAPRTGAGPSDAELATARSLYRDALLLHQNHKLQEALALLSAAYRTVKTPVIALELGAVEGDLGHLARAHAVLAAVADLPVSPRESDKGREARKDAAALAASLRERLATVKWAPAVGFDGELRLDGQKVDPTEGDRLVDPGVHALAFTTDGRVCASARVELREGETRVVDLRDASAPCAPARAPAAPPPVPGSSPPLESRTASALALAEPPAAPPPTRDASGPGVARWVGLGVAGAGTASMAIGLYVAMRARSDYDSVAASCPEPGCTRAAFAVRESARSAASAAGYAVGIGAAALVGGGLMWFLLPNGDHGAAGAVRVGIAPSRASLSVALP